MEEREFRMLREAAAQDVSKRKSLVSHAQFLQRDKYRSPLFFALGVLVGAVLTGWSPF